MQTYLDSVRFIWVEINKLLNIFSTSEIKSPNKGLSLIMYIIRMVIYIS